MTMLFGTHRDGNDVFSDERVDKGRRSAIEELSSYGAGSQVLVVCFMLDMALLALAPPAFLAVSALLGESFAGALAVCLIPSILVAQLTMLAIWLGLVATSLYWMLVAVLLLCVAVAFAAPNPVYWPTMLGVAWGGLTFSLPFALVRIAGFRLEYASDSSIDGCFRFPLTRLFVWTFVVAAFLGISNWIPRSVALPWATSLSFLGVSSIGLATLWCLLRPGGFGRWQTALPFAVLGLVVLVGQRQFRWDASDTTAVGVAGLVFVASLAGLLGIYRRAGMRLVAKSDGGWLVR